MFDILVVGYLFLGGAGAATIMLSCVIDLLWTKEAFGIAAGTSADTVSPGIRVVWFGLLVGFIALVVGILCLLFDLGRLDRFTYLFLHPSLSWLTVGSFSLLALLVAAAFLNLVRFLYLPDITRPVVEVVEAVTIVISVVVIVYTGLLLQSFFAVAFWNTPLVPILFSLSSVSAGLAVLLLVVFFGDHDSVDTTFLRWISRVDLIVIALELVCAGLFMYFSLTSTQPAEEASARQLFTGDGAIVWWGGFVVCGLVLSAGLELAASRIERNRIACLALAAVSILLGAFALRWGIVDTGMHLDLELESDQPELELASEEIVENSAPLSFSPALCENRNRIFSGAPTMQGKV